MERSVTCHQQSALQSTLAAYIHTATHTTLCVGTRTWLFQSARKGRGHEAAGQGVFHSVKPEYGLSMVYGLLHTTV